MFIIQSKNGSRPQSDNDENSRNFNALLSLFNKNVWLIHYSLQ